MKKPNKIRKKNMENSRFAVVFSDEMADKIKSAAASKEMPIAAFLRAKVIEAMEAKQ